MGAYEEIYSKIRGVSHKDPHTGMARQEIIKRFVRPGVSLRAELEPDNKFGDNAIALWLEPELGHLYHLGYIGSELAETLAPAMRTGSTVNVTVSAVTGGKGRKAYGVNIEVRVYEPSATMAEIATETTTPAKKRGCLWYVGLIVVILVVLFVCVSILGAM